MINEEGEVEKNFTDGFEGTEEENKYVRGYCLLTYLFSDFLINSFYFFQTTNIEIDIPSDLEGKKIIRLKRHAKEWGAAYLFHSCADVEFVKLSVSFLLHGF